VAKSKFTNDTMRQKCKSKNNATASGKKW